MNKKKYPYLDKGFVRAVKVLGDDKYLSQCARNEHDDEETRLPEQDDKLLRYMRANRHTSPFEQGSITYSIRLPIFIARQYMRHRTFRYNEISGRYRELDLGSHRPLIWRSQGTGKNKQKSGEPLSEAESRAAWIVFDAVDGHCWEAYQALLGLGVAREQARIVLPLAAYTEFTVNADLHNLMHFLLLRIDDHAQPEIQELAALQCIAFKEAFPLVFEAFRDTWYEVWPKFKLGGHAEQVFLQFGI